jgi:TetR/AcrR family transcriptional regulator
MNKPSAREMLSAPGAVRRRPSRRRDAAGTRNALLAAGTALFAERGYEGVPVWLIAQTAGVNKAMVNYHFGGKRKLYLKIVVSTFSEIVSRAESLASSSRPAPELLRELVAVVADVATRHPHFAAMMLREVLAGGKHLEPEVVDKPVRVLAAVRRIVERGVQEGAFRAVDPLLTHLSLVGSLVFFFATTRFRERVLADQRLGIKPPDGGAYVLHIQDLFIHGLAAGRAGAQAADPSRHGRDSGMTHGSGSR